MGYLDGKIIASVQILMEGEPGTDGRGVGVFSAYLTNYLDSIPQMIRDRCKEFFNMGDPAEVQPTIGYYLSGVVNMLNRLGDPITLKQALDPKCPLLEFLQFLLEYKILEWRGILSSIANARQEWADLHQVVVEQEPPSIEGLSEADAKQAMIQHYTANMDAANAAEQAKRALGPPVSELIDPIKGPQIVALMKKHFMIYATRVIKQREIGSQAESSLHDLQLPGITSAPASDALVPFELRPPASAEDFAYIASVAGRRGAANAQRGAASGIGFSTSSTFAQAALAPKPSAPAASPLALMPGRAQQPAMMTPAMAIERQAADKRELQRAEAAATKVLGPLASASVKKMGTLQSQLAQDLRFVGYPQLSQLMRTSDDYEEAGFDEDRMRAEIHRIEAELKQAERKDNEQLLKSLAALVEAMKADRRESAARVGRKLEPADVNLTIDDVRVSASGASVLFDLVAEMQVCATAEQQRCLLRRLDFLIEHAHITDSYCTPDNLNALCLALKNASAWSNETHPELLTKRERTLHRLVKLLVNPGVRSKQGFETLLAQALEIATTNVQMSRTINLLLNQGARCPWIAVISENEHIGWNSKQLRVHRSLRYTPSIGYRLFESVAEAFTLTDRMVAQMDHLQARKRLEAEDRFEAEAMGIAAADTQMQVSPDPEHVGKMLRSSATEERGFSLDETVVADEADTDLVPDPVYELHDCIRLGSLMHNDIDAVFDEFVKIQSALSDPASSTGTHLCFAIAHFQATAPASLQLAFHQAVTLGRTDVIKIIWKLIQQIPEMTTAAATVSTPRTHLLPALHTQIACTC